jgi:PAS domain S-box-containing protein
MPTKLYALLLEDVQKDAELISEMLSNEGFELTYDIVQTESDYVTHLNRNDYDIIFADFTLPSFNGVIALDLAKKICPDTPFICVSGTIGEDKAVELLKQGATDYVLKGRMERLVVATKRALDSVAQLKKFRNNELELQTNRQMLQTIINNALDAIYIKDIDGKYLLFNEAAEKAMGKKAAEVIRKDDTFIHLPEEAKSAMSIDRKVIETGIPYTNEETYTLADGNIHTFHTIKCPMFDDFGKPCGLFGIARDITDRKKMEHNLTEAKEKAEESDRLKTSFLHNISHEIRTPMNAIIGFSEFLNDPDLLPDNRKEFTDIIIQNAHQLLSIITDIICIATIEAGQEKITEKEFELNSTLKHIHSHFQISAQKQNIELNLNLSKELEFWVVSDETKLIQILDNLIGNAVKFTKQGHVNFGYVQQGSQLEFYVEDTGIGIPSELQEEIFKRFRQVETSSARNYGGSGLGLSISKAYVELLGGKMWMNSELGKGSTFFFSIPIKSTSKSELAEKQSLFQRKSNAESKTILVAEDEESNFMLIKVLLSHYNLNLLRAKNGADAVMICRSVKPIDLILMDLKMPVMDGYEATRQIREFLPEMPIIALTAYSTEVDKNKAISAGCNDFISKPIKKDILISKMEDQLYSE